MNPAPVVTVFFATLDDESIRQAVAELRNDEQIDAAIRLGLFSFAFCINHRQGTRYMGWLQWGKKPPEPPFTYEVPDKEVIRLLG